VTFVATANAEGRFILPLFIMAAKKVTIEGYPEWPACILAATDNGSMENHLFYEWAIKFVTQTQSSPANPSVLLLDNHTTHIFFPAIKHLKENGVTMITLPPNTTGLLCPLDVSFFRPFKSAFADAVSDIREFTGSLTLSQIIACCKKAFDRVAAVTHIQSEDRYEANIISGFRKCGFYPLDRNQPLDALGRDLAPIPGAADELPPVPVTPAAPRVPKYPPGSDEAKQLLRNAAAVGEKEMMDARAKAPGQGQIMTSDAVMQARAQKILDKAQAELGQQMRRAQRVQVAAHKKEVKAKRKADNLARRARGEPVRGRPPLGAEKGPAEVGVKAGNVAGKKRKRSSSRKGYDSDEDVRAVDVSDSEEDE
jgi:hypothetical protein